MFVSMSTAMISPLRTRCLPSNRFFKDRRKSCSYSRLTDIGEATRARVIDFAVGTAGSEVPTGEERKVSSIAVDAVLSILCSNTGGTLTVPLKSHQSDALAHVFRAHLGKSRLSVALKRTSLDASAFLDRAIAWTKIIVKQCPGNTN